MHGSDGLDEMTTTGTSYVAELKDGEVTTFEVAPEDAGVARAAPADLKGGSPQDNAKALAALLDGAPGPYRDVVLYNAAGALVVAGKAKTLADGVALAAAAIDGGHAKATLETLIAVTNAGGDGNPDP